MFYYLLNKLPGYLGSFLNEKLKDGSARSLNHIVKKMNDFGVPIPESGRLRFFSTLAIFFLIAFIYDILRTIKIALIVSQDAGAEIIPFIKIWGILPGTFLFALLFTLLVRRLGMGKVFYVMVSLFLAFYFLFIAFIYPNREFLEFHSGAEFLQAFLPQGAKGFVAMVRYWHYTLFYLFAELWGNIILNMLFWGFVNEITVFSDAKRYYSVFALSANIAPVIAGHFCLSFKNTDWDQSLNYFISTVLIAGVLLLAFFHLLSQLIDKEHRSELNRHHFHEDDSHEKFSLKESFRYVYRSKHLTYVMIVVLGYYIVYNLADVLWTDQIGLRFKGDTGALNSYLNRVSTIKGIIATFLALFISGKVIEKFGWYVAAMITPVLLAITSFLFFLSIFYDQGMFGDVLHGVISSPFIYVVVTVGTIQHCLVRASKYTVFDATKEMAFIPLSRSSQRMGKAVIDGIGARIGKSGGSFVFQFLLYFLGSLSATVPYVAVITGIILIAWIFAVTKLKNEIQDKLDEAV